MNTTTFNQEKNIADNVLHTYDTHRVLELEKEKETYDLIKEQIKEVMADFETGARNGSPLTSHGVSAEYKSKATINIREIAIAKTENREAILLSKSPQTNGPDDLVSSNGDVYQLKFHKELKDSLNGCIDHMKDYSSYTNNPKSFYSIPEDQFNVLIEIKNGNVPEGMSESEVKSILKTIAKYEEMKGGTIEDTIKSSEVTYDDAKTDKNDKFIREKKAETSKKHKEENEKIEENFSPSVKKCIETGLIAAGLGALTTAVFHTYNNIKQGKNIFAGDYTKEDYKDLALTTAKKGAIAGGMGSLFYGLNAIFKEKGGIVVLCTQIATALAPSGMAYAKSEISEKELADTSLSIVSSILLNSLGNVGVKKIITMIIQAFALGVLASITSGVILGIFLSLIVSAGVSYLIKVAKEHLAEFFGVFKQLFTPSYEEMLGQHKELLAIIEKEYQEGCKEIERRYKIINENIDVMEDLTLAVETRSAAVETIAEMENCTLTKIDPNSTLGSILTF